MEMEGGDTDRGRNMRTIINYDGLYRTYAAAMLQPLRKITACIRMAHSDSYLVTVFLRLTGSSN